MPKGTEKRGLKVNYPDVLQLEITDKDIEYGMMTSASRFQCPIAKVASDHFGIECTAIPNPAELHLWPKGIDDNELKSQFCIYSMDENGARFMDDFDTGRPVNPVTITMTKNRSE